MSYPLHILNDFCKRFMVKFQKNNCPGIGGEVKHPKRRENLAYEIKRVDNDRTPTIKRLQSCLKHRVNDEGLTLETPA